MNNMLKTAVLLAALASGAARAETFNFSYTFGNDGMTLSGSLSGDMVGSLIENVSDIHASFNGTDLTGTLNAYGWNAATHGFDTGSAAVISTDVSKNNFVFVDSTTIDNNTFNNELYFFNDSKLGHEAGVVNLNTGDIDIDNPSNASWSLTAVSAVPEADSVAMMLAGLGLVGVIARRRRA
jgi:hypothetical protein